MNSKSTLSRLVWSDELFETAVIDLNLLARSLDTKTLKICFILYDEIYLILDEDLSDLELGNFLRKFQIEDYVTFISRNNSNFESAGDIVRRDKYHRDFSRVRDEVHADISSSLIEVNDREISSRKFSSHIAEAIALSVQVEGVLVYSEEIGEYITEFLVSDREDYANDLRLDALSSLEAVNLEEKGAGYIKNLKADSFNLVRFLSKFDSPNDLLSRRKKVLRKKALLESFAIVFAVGFVSALTALENFWAGAILFGASIFLRHRLRSVFKKAVVEIYAMVNPLVKVFRE